MIRRLAALALLATALLARGAAAQTLFEVSGTPPLEAALWLPEGTARVPLVILLHGAGGAWADHAPLGAALAAAGIAAAGFTQVADRAAPNPFLRMAARARAGSRVLDAVLARAAERIDPARIGVFGYSAGATAALLLIGGRVDPGRWTALCEATPQERFCGTPFGRSALAAADTPPIVAADPRFRAAMLAAPALGFLFVPDGLAGVPPGTPLRLWRAGRDSLLAEPLHAEAIASRLPGRPVPQVVPDADHWVFMPPCTAERRTAEPWLCTDPPGFDRGAFHAAFNADAVAFFSAALGR
ncbi:dienelactone hydrolase [Roseomonas sp. JC162]|uniref:Dienelactone hydrolase n=1 Tax=Neoroseomonas marina TaxID=1232220 RepID=A0A848EGY2_9PROT|nr:dienelactone hydrolase [Neoroseomonas marina]NMJ42665.1 dienelactone hydrolase [Neoroseomonas marina]